MASHKNCDHPNTKGARQQCRMQDKEYAEARWEYLARPERKAAQAEYMREYRATPEAKVAHAERHAAWRKANLRANGNNPEAYAAKLARNIKRKKLIAGAECEPVDLRVVFDCDEGICHLCDYPVEWLTRDHPKYTTWAPTQDHIIPLQGEGEQGDHTYLNVRLAHRSCNSSKGNRPWTPAKRKAARARYRRDHPKAA